MSPSWTLEQICERLEAHRQRATYGALAGALFGDAKKAAAVGREISARGRTPRFSWIVRAGDGLPSKYARHERHEELEQNPGVIKADLLAWLETHPLPGGEAPEEQDGEDSEPEALSPTEALELLEELLSRRYDGRE